MKKSKELEIIKHLTNVDDDNRIVLNELGWTSRAYIIDNGKIVFKFLKNKEYQDELEHEANILKLIKEYNFDTDVPLIEWVGKDNTYIGFRGITGKSMTAEVVNELSEEQKRKVGKQIGLFIKKLHSIDYSGKNSNSENEIIEWLHESFRKRKRTLKKYFTENEHTSIEELVTSLPQRSAKLGIEEVFSHGDLGYNNIVLKDNHQVGIIDFGDAGNLDKSYDFTGLEDDIILDAALLEYGGDHVLREKVIIRRQLVPLMEMLFLIDKKDKEEEVKTCAERVRANLKA